SLALQLQFDCRCSAGLFRPAKSDVMKRLVLLPFLLLTVVKVGSAPEVPTMRLDYYHTGNATEERFSLDRVVVEPLPWPGNPDRPIDDTNRGKYFFEIVDDVGGKVIYSRGFSSI